MLSAFLLITLGLILTWLGVEVVPARFGIYFLLVAGGAYTVGLIRVVQL